TPPLERSVVTACTRDPSGIMRSAGTAIVTRTVWRRWWLSHATAVATPRIAMVKSAHSTFMKIVPGCPPSYMLWGRCARTLGRLASQFSAGYGEENSGLTLQTGNLKNPAAAHR